MLVEPSPTPTSWALHAQQRVGWQPSRFLADRAEAEHALRWPNSDIAVGHGRSQPG
jgi:hypothetical protein